MATETCDRCGEFVIRARLGDRSRTVDPRGRLQDVWLLLDPEPSPRGNVVISDGSCGYVQAEEWPLVKRLGIPVYRRHGLTCINPYNLKLFKGLNWFPEEET